MSLCFLLPCSVSQETCEGNAEDFAILTSFLNNYRDHTMEPNARVTLLEHTWARIG